MSNEHDELDRLLSTLAPSEAERDLLLEEHRLLEQDLFRLGDPLPPSDFLAQVMRKVEQAPARTTRADIRLATFLFGLSVGTGTMLLLRNFSLGSAGTTVAAFLVAARHAALGAFNAVTALWGSAALPVTLVLALVFGGALALLKRFAGRFDTAKVIS